MNVGKLFGGASIGTKLLLLLWGLSAIVLHLVTIGAAFFLAEGGLKGVAVGFVALCLPFVSWIGVFVWSWVAKGTFVNNYSQWFLAWLGFSALFLSLIPFGAEFDR